MIIREFLENIGVKSYTKAVHNPKTEKSKQEYISFLKQEQARKFSKKRDVILKRLEGE